MEFLSDGKTWTRGELLAYDEETSLYLASKRFKRSKKNGYHSSCSSTTSSFISIKSTEVSSSKRLQKEAESLSNLQKCPQVVDFYGDELTYEENGSEIYNILLEYASEGTLLDVIVNSNSIGLPEYDEYDVRRFTKLILLGLRYMHQSGYVHRNINPNSIQVFKNSSSLDVKIAEFGCAKKLKTEIRNTYRIGNPLYLAPEAINRYEQGPAGDIWALGCTVVEMLSGKPAWDLEMDVDEILERIGSGVESPGIPAGISKEGRDFLRMCFVRYSNFRWTADMLLHHPFIACTE